MRCKNCLEKSEFTLIPDEEVENSSQDLLESLKDSWLHSTTERYKCSNCNKTFRVDKEWMKNLKRVSSGVGTLSLVFNVGKGFFQIAQGDLFGGIGTIAKLPGNDNDINLG